MRRVLRRNDTEKPVGQLHQALLDAGDDALDDVALVPLKAVSIQQSDVVVIASAPCRSGFSRDERSRNVSVWHSAPKSMTPSHRDILNLDGPPAADTVAAEAAPA